MQVYSSVQVSFEGLLEYACILRLCARVYKYSTQVYSSAQLFYEGLLECAIILHRPSRVYPTKIY